MSNGIGGTAQWLAGVAVGAGVICWGIIPGMVGLGTQLSPSNGDLAKPGDVAQWLAANVARISGDFSLSFEKQRVENSWNPTTQEKSKNYLPQTYPLNPSKSPDDLGVKTRQGALVGNSQTCAGARDKNCDGIIGLDELEESP